MKAVTTTSATALVLMSLLSAANAKDTKSNSKHITPYCHTADYNECHVAAANNFHACAATDVECRCAQLNVLAVQCSALCPMTHVSNDAVIAAFCGENYDAKIASAPSPNLRSKSMRGFTRKFKGKIKGKLLPKYKNGDDNSLDDKNSNYENEDNESLKNNEELLNLDRDKKSDTLENHFDEDSSNLLNEYDDSYDDSYDDLFDNYEEEEYNKLYNGEDEHEVDYGDETNSIFSSNAESGSTLNSMNKRDFQAFSDESKRHKLTDFLPFSTADNCENCKTESLSLNSQKSKHQVSGEKSQTEILGSDDNCQGCSHLSQFSDGMAKSVARIKFIGWPSIKWPWNADDDDCTDDSDGSDNDDEFCEEDNRGLWQRASNGEEMYNNEDKCDGEECGNKSRVSENHNVNINDANSKDVDVLADAETRNGNKESNIDGGVDKNEGSNPDSSKSNDPQAKGPENSAPSKKETDGPSTSFVGDKSVSPSPTGGTRQKISDAVKSIGANVKNSSIIGSESLAVSNTPDGIFQFMLGLTTAVGFGLALI